MSDFVVVDLEATGTNPLRDELLCWGIGRNVYEPSKGRNMMKMLLAKPGVTAVAATNFDLRWSLLDGARMAEGVNFHDLKVMAWLLDATQDLDVGSLSAKYLGHVPPKPIFQKGGKAHFHAKGGDVLMADVPWEELVEYNLSDLEVEAELYEVLRAELKKQGLWEHFLEEEAPFSRLLVEMEVAGVPFDVAGAADMLESSERRAEVLRAELVEAVGVPDFNPGSNAQVSDFLYGELLTFPVKFAIPRLTGKTKEYKQAAVESIAPAGVKVERIGREYAYGSMVVDGRCLRAPAIDKNKPVDSRPTVGAKVLTVMHGDDPWVSRYLEWKKHEKLMGYLRKWLELEHDGRLYGHFDQSGTVTGRLSSREPNLQQVSSSGEVRDLFRLPPACNQCGCSQKPCFHFDCTGTLIEPPAGLMVGDYAGLEVRLSAHFSRDPLMLEIFEGGKDLYGVLAANAWGGPGDKSNEARGLMKVLMLSSQYGARGEKLSEILAFAGMRGYTARKSNMLLKDLERTLPRLFEWREEVIAEARALGYVTTLAGRKRHLPDINSAVWKTMATAERQAVNSKVQGSAADVVRRAMLRARRVVRPEEALIILQVHDEVIWERGPEWRASTFDRLKEICETGHGFDLDVPLSFDAKVASSWADKGGSGGQVKAGEYGHVAEAMA